MKKFYNILLFALIAIMMPIGASAQIDDYITIDTETGTVTIDGTLGGKAEATDAEVEALVQQLKDYVDSGIITIIVTGAEPALIDVSGIIMPAVSEAIYRLTDSGSYDENNPYNGKIDLILQDVTEIMAFEFYTAFALNSITLPKVTTIGDEAFQGCAYMKQITFGSVVTSIEEENGVTFFVGYKVGGCDLVLNCGQMQTEDTYKPDLENNVWFKPNWGGGVTWKSITLTHGKAVPGSYENIGPEGHTYTCSACGATVTEAHSGGSATCSHLAECEHCGAEYGEPDPDAHSYNEDGFCEMCSTANPDETMFFIFDGDHKAFNVAEDLVGVNIEYTRGLHNTEWNSIYLPFEVPVTEGLLDEFEFAYVNDMHSADTDDNGEIDEIEMEIVKIKTGTLHANHPYFIRAKSEYTILQLSCENTTLHATKETTLNCSSIYMDYAIVGSYKHIKGTEFASMPADRYYAISIDGGWWQIPEDSSLYPFRAYLSMTARDGSPVKVSDEAMRSIRIREKGEGTTGIEEVKGENGEVKTIYDLQGRKVEVPSKGLYIINGKKVLIK